MSHSGEPAKTTKSSQDSQRSHHYVLKPSLHLHGWKLEVRADTGHLLYEITRLPTQPIRYRLKSPEQTTGNPLKIKTLTIDDVTRYSLVDGAKELLSIRATPTTSMVLLRDQERKTIARFSPLNPEVVILRTPTTSIARLRFKEKPAPLHFQVESEAIKGLQWLHAVILYTVARIEAHKPGPLPEEVDQDEDETSKSGETVTP